MKPLGILFFGIAAVLLGVGILFHYKEKNDYGNTSSSVASVSF